MSKRNWTPKRRRVLVDLLATTNGPLCGVCRLTPEDVYDLTIDHIDPSKRAPWLDHPDNLRLLCRSCNGRRGAVDMHAGRPHYPGVTEREGEGASITKDDSDEYFADVEARAVDYVDWAGGRASQAETKAAAGYGIVRPQKVDEYWRQIIGPSGRLKPSDKGFVELRLEHERWRPRWDRSVRASPILGDGDLGPSEGQVFTN